MSPKLSQSLGMAGLAAAITVTPGCHKKSAEGLAIQQESSISTASVKQVERDMSYAPPFELSGKVKYGEEIPKELLDREVYGFDRKTYKDLNVDGSGKDMVKRGVRAQVHSILATDRPLDEVKFTKEPGALIDPLAVPIGKENGAIWISTVIPSRSEADELFGSIYYVCVDSKGRVYSQTSPDLIEAQASGHARWRGWVSCAEKPGPFAVGVSISDRKNNAIFYYERGFNAVENETK